MNFKPGQFVVFSGYRCRVVDTFDGKGTPVPSSVTLRVAQRWYQFASPPIEYVVSETRWSEITMTK